MKYSYGQYFVGKNVPAHLEQFFKSLDSSHLKKKLMHLKGSKHKKGKITQTLFTSPLIMMGRVQEIKISFMEIFCCWKSWPQYVTFSDDHVLMDFAIKMFL